LSNGSSPSPVVDETSKAATCAFQPGQRPSQIDLVSDHDDIGGWNRRSPLRHRVDHPQNEIGVRRPRLGARNAFALDRIVGLADAGGVEHRDRIAGQIEMHFDHVARRAREPATRSRLRAARCG